MKYRILLLNDDSREILIFRQIFSTEYEQMESLASLSQSPYSLSKKSMPITEFELLFAHDCSSALVQIQSHLDSETPVSILFVSLNHHKTAERIEFAKKVQQLDARLYLVVFTEATGEQFGDQLQALESSTLLLKKPFDTDEVKQLALHFAEEWRKDSSLAGLQQGLEKKMVENIFEASMYSLLNPILLSISDKINSQVGLLSFLQDHVEPIEESRSTFEAINHRLQEDSKRLTNTVRVVQQLFSTSNEITVFTVETARRRIFNLIPELNNLPDDIEFNADLRLDPNLSLSLPTNLMILSLTSLLRNALESVNKRLLNARSHLQKGRVNLRSEMVSDERLSISIEDNGEGFEAGRFDTVQDFIDSGILSPTDTRFQVVKVFVERVKAEFSIKSEGIGKGVVVTLILPLSIHQVD